MNKYKQAWTLLRAYTEDAVEHEENWASTDWLESLNIVDKLYGIKTTRRDLDEIIEEIKEED